MSAFLDQFVPGVEQFTVGIDAQRLGDAQMASLRRRIQ